VPWYADHPTDAKIRQETYFLEVVIPFVDRAYPTLAKQEGRLLVGFSKSGWGAFSLLLRHPLLFGKAVAWDAPLMMQRPDKNLPAMADIFGTQENFEKYRISALLEKRAAKLSEPPRLIHFGYGNYREQHQSAHKLMEELKIPHQYRDGPKREHSWSSGWLRDAVQMLWPCSGSSSYGNCSLSTNCSQSFWNSSRSSRPRTAWSVLWPAGSFHLIATPYNSATRFTNAWCLAGAASCHF
jgi:S-formylglutathione hydrolase FrmB